MKIRAITIGQKIPYLIDSKSLEEKMSLHLDIFYRFNNELINRFKEINIEVQTKRLCSQPILSYNQQLYEQNLNETLIELHNQLNLIEGLLSRYGIDYFASCAILADEQILKYGVYEKLMLGEIPQFIKKTQNFFSSLHVASTENGINLSGLRSGAKIIKKLSEPDPFKNLNFCVSSNVKPDTPFFPAAYHISENPSFGLAIEMADEVVKVFEVSNSIQDDNSK